MCRDADRAFAEATSLDEPGLVIDRLSHELACLIDLGALASEEEEAFSSVLQDIQALAARVWSADMQRREERLQAIWSLHELLQMVRFLAADLDLAYQRLGFAA